MTDSRPNPNTPPVVSFDDVSFRYGKPWVLEGVNFSISEGESLSVIGPNGGGKSTLMKLILGLEETERGTIRVLGLPPVKARCRMGYVPQAMRFDPLFPISALEIVLMGRLDRLKVGTYGRQCREIAMASLAEVDMADLAKRPFSDLSGGERQRVMIARALACEPDLLLLDEPTANIDLSIEEQFLGTLEHLRDKMNILLVTHDLDLVSAMGNSVLCVNRRVHRHSLPLSGDTIREIYSGGRRIEHDRRARHQQGDHSACEHD